VELGRVGTPENTAVLALNFERSSGWHELRVVVGGFPEYLRRLAGRVETGRDGFSDPQIGAT
jgi:phospholipase C